MSWPKHNAEWWRTKIAATRERDIDTDRRLELEGWAVVRVWEHDDVDLVAERIRALVLARRHHKNAG